MVVYTCAFAFCEESVLLVRKAKPEWQKGLLNGIGGKVEPGESVLEATVREFKEETELWQEEANPQIFHAMLWQDYESHTDWPLVYFSAWEISRQAMSQAVKDTMLGVEPCVIMPLGKIPNQRHAMMPNLPFLISMAECLVRCSPEQRKLRQPVVPIVEFWQDWVSFYRRGS